MAYKTLLFGTDDLYDKLKPFYYAQIQRGILDVVAYAVFEKDGVRIVPIQGTGGGDILDVDIVIVSSRHDLYRQIRLLESMGIPRSRIIDGQVFQIPQLDFPRLLKDGVAYGMFDGRANIVVEHCVYRSVLKIKDSQSVINLGRQSFLSGCTFEDDGELSVGDFSSLSWNILFELGLNRTHNFNNVTQYDMGRFGALVDADFYPPWALDACRIDIGSDVWIGRGCILKCTNPKKPLVIGDGAVIAADSVVVKNVPPYAIVGGNPAQIIKYRFAPDVVDALLRIKWWNWSLDKIHDNFKQFNDVNKFISLHDV